MQLSSAGIFCHGSGQHGMTRAGMVQFGRAWHNQCPDLLWLYLAFSSFTQCSSAWVDMDKQGWYSSGHRSTVWPRLAWPGMVQHSMTQSGAAQYGATRDQHHRSQLGTAQLGTAWFALAQLSQAWWCGVAKSLGVRGACSGGGRVMQHLAAPCWHWHPCWHPEPCCLQPCCQLLSGPPGSGGCA